MANQQTREAAKALILRVTRAGFKQYRKVNEGYLYGSGTYRFMIPYSVVKQAASPSYIEELTRRFEEVREARDAEYGKPKPLNPVLEQPIEDPEDLLREEGGPPAVDSDAPNVAGEGSTPSPSATPIDADAGWGPGIATPAPEGSSPSVGTTTNIAPTEEGAPRPEGETTMAKTKYDKRGRRRPDPWVCPKCGETFGAKGRHEASCTGKPSKKAPRVRSVPEQNLEAKASTNGHGGILEAYETAFTAFTRANADLMTLLKHSDGELRILKRENEELRAFKQRASALFEPESKVPRG